MSLEEKVVQLGDESRMMHAHMGRHIKEIRRQRRGWDEIAS